MQLGMRAGGRFTRPGGQASAERCPNAKEGARGATMGSLALLADVGELCGRVALLEHGDQRRDDTRVELRPRAPLELGERLVAAARSPVGACARDRVVRICDEDDPRAERDLLAPQPR